MAFNIKIPFVIATHIKKYSSTSGLKNKSKAAAIGMVSGIPYIHDGSVVQPLNGSQTLFCTTQFDAVTGTTGTTLTNVVGLTSFSLAAGAKYQYEIFVSGVSTANCGMKLGLGFTTLTAAAHEAVGKGYTASAVAVQHTTTATSGMTLFGQTAAVIAVDIRGTLTTTLAGTVAVQAAQNAAHADTTSVFVGSWATFTRIS